MFGDEQGDPDPPTNVGLFPSSPGKGKPGQFCQLVAMTDAAVMIFGPRLPTYFPGD